MLLFPFSPLPRSPSPLISLLVLPFLTYIYHFFFGPYFPSHTSPILPCPFLFTSRPISTHLLPCPTYFQLFSYTIFQPSLFFLSSSPFPFSSTLPLFFCSCLSPQKQYLAFITEAQIHYFFCSFLNISCFLLFFPVNLFFFCRGVFLYCSTLPHSTLLLSLLLLSPLFFLALTFFHSYSSVFSTLSFVTYF